MAATFIGSATFFSGGGNTVSATLSSVQVGDLIVAAMAIFFTRSSTWAPTVSDSLGNVYTADIIDYGDGGSGAVAMLYSIATVAGAPVITFTQNNADTQGADVIVANYRNPGKKDQSTYLISSYTPSGAPIGTYTSGINLADTLVIAASFVTDATLVLSSDSGDTLRASVRSFALFDAMNTGPGNRLVKIKSSAGQGTWATAVMTFSQPLTRPGGLQAQYAVRPGAGYNDTTYTPFFTKRPITVSLPYIPAIGSLLIVGSVEQSVATSSPSVTDAYGNSYTFQASSNANGTRISFFTSLVANLPPTGEVFMVTFNGSVTGSTTYQTTALAIAERVVTGTPGSFQSAGWLSNTAASPVVAIKSSSISSVPSGAYLIALGTYAADSNQFSIAWSPSGAYSLDEHWDLFSLDGATSERKMGTAAIVDQITASPGTYDAQISGSITGPFNASNGNILLLAVNLQQFGCRYYWE